MSSKRLGSAILLGTYILLFTFLLFIRVKKSIPSEDGWFSITTFLLWGGTYYTLFAHPATLFGISGWVENRPAARGLWLTLATFVAIFGVLHYLRIDDLPETLAMMAFWEVPIANMLAAALASIGGFIVGRWLAAKSRNLFYSMAHDQVVSVAVRDYGVNEQQVRTLSSIGEIADYVSNNKGIDRQLIMEVMRGSLIGAWYPIGGSLLALTPDDVNEHTNLREPSISLSSSNTVKRDEYLRIALMVAEEKFGILPTDLQETKSINEMASHIAAVKGVNSSVARIAIVAAIAEAFSIRVQDVDCDKSLHADSLEVAVKTYVQKS
ncbi:MAG TPA: hypothetical protein VGM52_06725 [Herbaspirillum sp.]|jgi:hypothetical protein